SLIAFFPPPTEALTFIDINLPAIRQISTELWASCDGGMAGVFSTDGEHIVIAQQDQTLVLVNFKTGQSRVITDAQGVPIQKLYGFDFDISPDGRTLVYTKGKDLWVIDIFSGENRLLLASPTGNELINPNWSPDGSHIAFHFGYIFESVTEFGIVSADDSRLSRWGDVFVNYGFYDWSPDGRYIVFSDIDYISNQASLYIANLNGSIARTLTSVSSTFPLSPRWSRNGQYIAFNMMSPNNTQPSGSLWIISPDGTNLKQLPLSPAQQSGEYVTLEAWSPDSRNLLVAVDFTQLYILPINGDSPTFIGNATCPTWQPPPNPSNLVITIVRNNYEIYLDAIFDAANQRYVIQGGAYLIILEIQNLIERMHSTGDRSLAVDYFMENIGGVEELRNIVETTVCGQKLICRESLRYKIGSRLMDTSGLGNIAFGYIMTSEFTSIQDREDFIANMAQRINRETREEAFTTCQNNLICVAELLRLVVDNPDDQRQREVGRALALAVRENNDEIGIEYVDTLEDLADQLEM
ncbi:MAG: hypothetical protein K8L97_06015, partial [Anaerolineae bacterium]|nr:hypothetical protein [Anaerolineae bacterium]